MNFLLNEHVQYGLDGEIEELCCDLTYFCESQLYYIVRISSANHIISLIVRISNQNHIISLIVNKIQ